MLGGEKVTWRPATASSASQSARGIIWDAVTGVRLLLDYAFRVRSLRRVWVEAHAANEHTIRAYTACGFVEKGRMRGHIWLAGRYMDNVIMGVLREERREGRTVG